MYIYNNMGIKLNLLNRKFGKLKVIAFSKTIKGCTFWLCKCECGNEKIIKGSSLTSFNTKTCGCSFKENGLKHGLCYCPEYGVWNQLKQRCYNSKNPAYKNYGGRGIEVCNLWLNSFENFYKDMGKKPSSEYTIERINNNLGYYFENCRWATRLEQGRNKRNNVIGINALMTRQRRWQVKMKADNRCTMCGNNRNGTNKSYCINCTIKVREYQRVYVKAKKIKKILLFTNK